MVLIHGFGGNADHWRKNLPTLAKTGPAYAIDLLGEADRSFSTYTYTFISYIVEAGHESKPCLGGGVLQCVRSVDCLVRVQTALPWSWPP